MEEKRVDNSYSILVIEDNPGDFYLIQEYLAAENLIKNIVHVSTFSEAKHVLNGKSFVDVILLDLTLPDLSGEMLISQVTKRSGNAVTIALTGYSDMDFSIKSLGMGVSDYLLKDELTQRSLAKSVRYSLERKATSINLEKSEERYRELFEGNPNPMIIYKNETRDILHVNRAALNKYGYKYSEFIELGIDDIRLSEQEENMFKNGTRELTDSFWVHKKRTGKVFFAEVNSLQLEYNDQKSSLEIINDITEKIEMQEKMIENTMRAEEHERNRIAKDLHDSIVQKLVACGMFAQNLKDSVNNNDLLEQEIETLSKLIRDISNETRDLSHNLKSAEFDFTSLSQLVVQLTRQLTKESRVQFIFNNFLQDEDDFKINFKVHVYRILQELSNNVIKHSGAAHAVINIEVVNDTLYITFNDNGIGFDINTAQQNGIGLRNIKSRVYRLGGVISFERLAVAGIQVHIELPVSRAKN